MKRAGKIVLAFLILALVSKNIFSQEPSLKRYDITKGLPSNECYKVIQDKKGYLWVASDKGLSRYNGYSFQNFTKKEGLPDNVVIQLFEDYKGRIWTIGLNAKVAYFENEAFYPLKELNLFLETNVKNAQIHSAYVNDKDELHLGFNLYYPNLITYSLLKKQVIEQKKIEDKMILIKTSDLNDFIYGVYGISSAESPYYKLRLNIEQELKSQARVEVDFNFRPSMVRYLYLSAHSFLISLDRKLFLIAQNKSSKLLELNTNVLFLYKDHKNRIWVLTQNDGVYILEVNDLLNKHLKHIYTGYSFSSVTEDKEHNYWLSSLRDGLYQIPNFDIVHYPIHEKDSKTKMNAIVKHNNTIYASGCTNNIYSYDKEDKISKCCEVPETHFEVTDMLAQKKSLIIAGTSSYLASASSTLLHLQKIENNRSYYINSNFHIKYIDASKANEDTILAGTSKGFCNLSVNKAKKISCDFMPPVTINNVYVDSASNRIYLACLDGLYYVPNRKIPFTTMADPLFNSIRNHFSSYTEKAGKQLYIVSKNGEAYYTPDNYLSCSHITDSLLNTRINYITKKGKLFILSSEERGIIFWDGKKSWNIDLNSGLASNVCKKALLDKQGNIWVATNKGMSKIEIKPNGHYEINNLTSHEGLYSDDVYNFNIIDDDLWIPTESGVTKFSTYLGVKNNIQPPVYITSIAVDDSAYKIQPFSEIPYNHNYIKISYNGLSYKNNGDLSYEYRLMGLDSNWKKTKNIQVEFTRLAAGEYSFEVRAIKNNHIKSSRAAVFSYIIYPPWYNTWWFLSFSIIITVFAIYLFFWIRFKRLKAREEEKTKLITQVTETEIKALRAQTNPHFIFNALNSISLFVLKNDSDQAQFYLMRFAQLMRDVLENSEYDVISLSKEFSILKTYMELEVLRFNEKYKFEILIPEGILNAKIFIPPLLLQPIIENAIWHGLMPLEDREGFLLLKVDKTDYTVIITIEDNGIGRKKSAEIKAGKISHKTSKGIFMTKNRIDLFNQKHMEQIKIVTTDLIDNNQKPLGTRVEIIIENISQNP